jgi:hypothetical protein
MTREQLAYARGAMEKARVITDKIEAIESAIGVAKPLISFRAGVNMAEELPESLRREVFTIGLATLKESLEDELTAIDLNMPRPPSGVVS